ncbi:MAG: hypothetical protein U5M53_06545 [Rhodoferax sp.]|nr:hypothetical protein [Rhodoferax sp.]
MWKNDSIICASITASIGAIDQKKAEQAEAGAGEKALVTRDHQTRGKGLERDRTDRARPGPTRRFSPTFQLARRIADGVVTTRLPAPGSMPTEAFCQALHVENVRRNGHDRRPVGIVQPHHARLGELGVAVGMIHKQRRIDFRQEGQAVHPRQTRQNRPLPRPRRWRAVRPRQRSR